MFKLREDNNENTTFFSGRISPQDKKLLMKLGQGNMAKGFRMILDSVRENAKKVIKKRKQ